jgi:uncharacterized membrane protein YhaH (DUF805 family)
MSSNPYASPEAHVADPQSQADGERQDWKQLLFSTQGRIPRKAYWINGFLPLILIYLVIILAITLIFGANNRGPLASILIVPVYFVFLWASLCLQIKRWHDRDKTGWWVLIAFVPLIGAIWAFVEVGCLRGTEGENRFGGDATGLY